MGARPPSAAANLDRPPVAQVTGSTQARGPVMAAADETTDLCERTETTDAAAEETTDAADDTELVVGADDPGSRRVFFIGIGGPSCSGKSTLASRLALALNSPLKPVPLDGYFVPSRMPVHPKFGTNWETPEGVDFQMLLQDLNLIEEKMSCTEAVPRQLVIKADPSRGGGNMIHAGMAGRPLEPGAPVVVVVEGFLLFYERAVSAMFDCSLWVQADCRTCAMRRHRRDAPDLTEHQFHEWYAGLVWSHFEMYQERQLANADGALRLDAKKEPGLLEEDAVAYCRALLSLR